MKIFQEWTFSENEKTFLISLLNLLNDISISPRTTVLVEYDTEEEKEAALKILRGFLKKSISIENSKFRASIGFITGYGGEDNSNAIEVHFNTSLIAYVCGLCEKK